jgi:hypothetical protein
MLRPELIVGDLAALFIIWIIASPPPTTFGEDAPSSIPWPMWLGLAVALFGLGWMHAIAWQMRDRSISMGRPPKLGWFATRGMLRLADASVIGVVVLLLTPGDPTWGAEPSIAGLPPRIVALLLALPVALIGATWMHRIAREGSEPEAFDQHWWSRA